MCDQHFCLRTYLKTRVTVCCRLADGFKCMEQAILGSLFTAEIKLGHHNLNKVLQWAHYLKVSFYLCVPSLAYTHSHSYRFLDSELLLFTSSAESDDILSNFVVQFVPKFAVMTQDDPKSFSMSL
jgi:hypothetical protein